jgi:hypothetical protein
MFRRVSNSIICVSCTAQSEARDSLSLWVRETCLALHEQPHTELFLSLLPQVSHGRQFSEDNISDQNPRFTNLSIKPKFCLIFYPSNIKFSSRLISPPDIMKYLTTQLWITGKWGLVVASHWEGLGLEWWSRENYVDRVFIIFSYF